MPRKARRASDTGRFSLVLAGLVTLLLAVSVRLVWVQAVSAGDYRDQAEKQRTRDVQLAPRRGAVYDREGEPLAVSIPAMTVYATPHAIKDPKATAAVLAEVLGGDAAEYERKLRRESGFVYIARKADPGRVSVLEERKLRGIEVAEDSRRTYPSGELACQVLGFVGVDDRGLAGIERYYDGLLRGRPGRVIAERDPFGRPIPGGVKHSERPVHGQAISLTIDKDIQYQAQLELAATVERFKAKAASVVVMDPESGEILAMASVPSYDPNKFKEAAPAATRNRPVSDAYEPGSTIKALTAAAVIERGLATTSTMYDLPPTLKLGGRTIHEAHGRGTARWSLAQIVTKSSNIGAVKLGIQLGPQALYDEFKRFGLDEPCGIDFPGEEDGYLPHPKQWSASSIGNIPFGQGVSATPVQLSRALAAIANGGELVTPHFLKGLPERTDITRPWKKQRILAPRTSELMIDVLRQVVDDGTGKSARVPGYSVAGKTGTAQKTKTGGGGYASGKYVASFAGFLPAEDPKVLIVVTVDEPSAAIYGGSVAAPAFSRIAQFAVSHLKIPPSSAAGRGGAL